MSRIESVHSKGFIHRDIKPDNFLIGRGKFLTTLFVIDFGLTKKYIDAKTNEHIPFSDKKALTGTARYASIHSHNGYEQSRRDDLESIGYVLIYFLKGSLPWQGVTDRSQDNKYSKIKEIKASMPLHVMCSDIPIEFQHIVQYCRDLKYDKEPDYKKMQKWMKDTMATLKLEDDGLYDWNSVTPSSPINTHNITKEEANHIYRILTHHQKRKNSCEDSGLLSSPNIRKEVYESMNVNSPIDSNSIRPIRVSRVSCCKRGNYLFRLYNYIVLVFNKLSHSYPHITHHSYFHQCYIYF